MKGHIYFKNNIFVLTLFLISFFGCSKNSSPNNSTPLSPSIRLVSPTTSIVTDDTVYIQAETIAFTAVKVEIYVDNLVPQGGTLTFMPYIYLWNIANLLDSSVHQIYAKAYDANNITYITPTFTTQVYKFAPTKLIATVISDSVFNLTWTDNCKSETGFEIERKINNGAFELIKTVGANITASQIKEYYSEGDSVFFRVRAINPSSKSKYSNVVAKKIAHDIFVWTPKKNIWMINDNGWGDSLMVSDSGFSIRLAATANTSGSGHHNEVWTGGYKITVVNKIAKTAKLFCTITFNPSNNDSATTYYRLQFRKPGQWISLKQAKYASADVVINIPTEYITRNEDILTIAGFDFYFDSLYLTGHQLYSGICSVSNVRIELN